MPRLILRTIASDATYSVAGNRIISVGTAELRRQRISHASIGRWAKDAVARVVELVRGSRLDVTRSRGAAKAPPYRIGERYRLAGYVFVMIVPLVHDRERARSAAR